MQLMGEVAASVLRDIETFMADRMADQPDARSALRAYITTVLFVLNEQLLRLGRAVDLRTSLYAPLDRPRTPAHPAAHRKLPYPAGLDASLQSAS